MYEHQYGHPRIRWTLTLGDLNLGSGRSEAGFGCSGETLGDCWKYEHTESLVRF